VDVEIRRAQPAELGTVRELIEEYVRLLGVDLEFQDLESELADLATAYGPPGGVILVALVDGAIVGCVALRPLEEGCCEMKRLFVRPAFRRFGMGRVIAQALLDEAQQIGYSEVLLDTLDDMEAARGLYASLGFEEIPPYYYNPIPGAHYLKATLGVTSSQY
jgi:putative acetyltransferase